MTQIENDTLMKIYQVVKLKFTHDQIATLSTLLHRLDLILDAKEKIDSQNQDLLKTHTNVYAFNVAKGHTAPEPMQFSYPTEVSALLEERKKAVEAKQAEAQTPKEVK